MRNHLNGIDHVVVVVGDLDQAVSDYEALGFNLTPRGHHSMGSANHCAMFGKDYLELLGLPPGFTGAPAFARFLESGGPGLAALALRTDDAQGAHAELQAAGMTPGEVRDFSRPVDLDGRQAEARFRTLDMPPEGTPGAHTFACQHYTPEVAWRPGYDEHPNGVTGLESLVLVSETPEQDLECYGALLDVPVEPYGLGWRVEMPGASLIAVEPENVDWLAKGQGHAPRALPHLAVIRFRVTDLARTAGVLAQAGVSFLTQADGNLQVSPDHAQGVTVVFVL